MARTNMRFHQLAIGAQFQFKGGVYTKSSPVMASDTSGKQLFMKRSDEVEPVTGPQEVPADDSQPQRVLAEALSTYTNQAMEIIHNHFHPADAGTLNKVHARLQELEQGLLQEKSKKLD